MVTVEADPVRVESRLVAGLINCPEAGCAGALRPWGWARSRSVRGLPERLRPRRARCGGCEVTHVLLPVTVLLRRADAAEVIGAGLAARARGLGHRPIGVALGVPAATVRGWLRRLGGRLDATRVFFLQVAVLAGVDVVIPDGLGSRWADLLAALGAATAAVTSRFGTVGVVGTVTGWQVAVACSGGRLLAPGWPAWASGGGATPVASDALAGVSVILAR